MEQCWTDVKWDWRHYMFDNPEKYNWKMVNGMSLKREAVAQPLPTIDNLDGSKSFCKFVFLLWGFLRFTAPFKIFWWFEIRKL